MLDQVKKHIERFIEITDEEFAIISGYFIPMQAAKKQNLLIEGKINTASYFVVKGCLRMFFVNDKGVERTTQFALENWWLADYTSFSNRQPSGFHIQAVEKCDLLRLDFAAHEQLLEQCPRMEKYFRLIHQRAHAASQFRIKLLYEYSREQLYFDFIARYPVFVQRIPQYLLASYLGFTPEYLSEIRNKRIS